MVSMVQRQHHPLTACFLVILCSCVVTAKRATADGTEPAWVRVELTDGTEPNANGALRTVEGAVRVEAVDGGLLLEQGDGRLDLFQPDAIASRTSIPLPTTVQTPRQLGQRVLGELPPGFDMVVTKHYVVCFDTSREYAQWATALFERLHDGFTNFWTHAGFDVYVPKRPLIVVIFSDRRRYEEYAARDLGAATDRVVGYYNMLSNRVTTFDLTGVDAFQADTPPRGRATISVLARPEAAGLVATLIHEGTHQLAFNCGLHQRLAPVPLWICEGVATYFEAPDLASSRGWRAIGMVNTPRRDQFLKLSLPGWLEPLLRDDAVFRNPDTATAAYAHSWALTAYLIKTRKQAFVGYLRELAKKGPCESDSGQQRIAEFSTAFGQPDAAMEQAVTAFIVRMR